MAGLTLAVRTLHGAPRRFRSGLGPFGPDPVVIQATQEQAEDLVRDPYLGVTVVDAVPVADQKKKKS